MPFSIIPKQIFTVRFVQHLLGPPKTKVDFIADIESIGNKYGLTNLMCLSVMEGSVSDSNDWHESILSQIEQHEERSYFDRTLNNAQFEIYNSVHPHSLSMSSLGLAAKVIPNSLPQLSYSAELLVKIDSVWLENPCNCCACGSPYTNAVVHAVVHCELTASQRESL